MSVFPPRDETWLVTLECLGDLPGPRFLAGDIAGGSVGLVAQPGASPAATSWAVARLSSSVVKLRCLDIGEGARFLDGRTRDGTVGMRPMLASPPSGEWWEVSEAADGSVTLRCLSRLQNPSFQFLDGRTQDGSVGLAPNTSPPFTGTRWRVALRGRIVALECQGTAFGPNRFLDGRVLEHSTGLAPTPLSRFTGARWLLHHVDDAVTLKCLGELDGEDRFLNGRPTDRVVDLLAGSDSPEAGTRWAMTPIDNPHADVELGTLATFRCLAGPDSGFRFLDGITQEGRVSLAPTTDPPFTGTKWRVLPAGIYWEPCPRVLEPPDPKRTVDVTRTFWVGQLTGSVQPGGRPLINGDTSTFGVPGVDLGANAEDGHGRLFIYFGDVVRGERSTGPVVDADLVAFTVDFPVEELPDEGGGGIRLNPIMAGQFFDEFRVEGPSGIGVTPTFEVASGAFAHADQMFVFFHIWDSVPRPSQPPQGCYLARKSPPTQPGPFEEVCLFSPRVTNGVFGPDVFGGVAPVKVDNRAHAWLPPGAAELADEGVVMFGNGLNPGLGYSAVHLAWMPLRADVPQLDDVRYLVGGDPTPQWEAVPDRVLPLFGKEANLQSISASFLPGPGKWIVVHMTADPTKCINGPIIARIGTPPFDWSEAFALFDPCRERAYGRYMHWPDLDGIHLADPRRDPTSPPPDPAIPGWAYGAFLLDRYTRWNGDTRELELYYLLSLGSPYQVQLMHTTVQLR